MDSGLLKQLRYNQSTVVYDEESFQIESTRRQLQMAKLAVARLPDGTSHYRGVDIRLFTREEIGKISAAMVTAERYLY